ncbi:helix-turn-helix domain-containing protein [Novosphingobium sp. G106]|uniref:MerR family transcriptional regulator n=1 Tax=Novosphingobium sp. G106 TaxID=2849500 RepID=UPI001C2D541B|nr:helix-turn-helix domain-containing protein [Novosphingobium sp. G106]MBV1692396.1 helix-turn-helix domain-containing protein [Novosphingobium sp. G106]
MKIGELAKATATKVETVRYYEQTGLLPAPARTQGNYRSYGSEHLARLSFIRRARDLGFAIEQVRALLDLSDDQARDCATVDQITSEHLREVDRKIADLTALRRELSAVIASCGGGTVAECRIIEALAPDPDASRSRV